MGLVRLILNIYCLILIVDALLSYFPQVRRQDWAVQLKRAADLSLRPIRKILPDDLPLDPSPLIAILLIRLLMTLY